MADLNRKTAYDTLLEIEKNQAYSNIELNHQIQLHSPENPSFVRELVYGVLENKIYLDYILSSLIPKGLRGVKKPVLVLLRMGLYQIIFMDTVPLYAAVNETVKLSKKTAPGREGFINGVLRGYEKKKESIELPDRETDLVQYLSVKYSFHPSIVELWLSQFSIEETESLLHSSNMRPQVSIRVNTLKTSLENLTSQLESLGFMLNRGSFSDRVLFVRGKGLLETKAYRQGLFSIQDEASVMAVEMLNPVEGNTVLDICAAPGGKTLAMAEMMKNRGIIYGFDVYTHKLELLKKEEQRLGIDIIETAQQDGTRLNSRLLDYADKVLVDGPCSGLGVLRRKPELKFRVVENKARGLAEKQTAILNNACRYVKPGGDLVYSTCTINRVENDEVIERFLRCHEEYELVESRQLMPGRDETDGFFICKMHRKEW